MKIIQITVAKRRKIPGIGKDKYGAREYFVSVTADLEEDENIPLLVNELFKGAEQAIIEELRKDRYGDVSLPNPEEEVTNELMDAWVQEEREGLTPVEEEEIDPLRNLKMPQKRAINIFDSAWRRSLGHMAADKTISFAAMWGEIHGEIPEKDFDAAILTLLDAEIIEQPRLNQYRWKVE